MSVRNAETDLYVYCDLLPRCNPYEPYYREAGSVIKHYIQKAQSQQEVIDLCVQAIQNARCAFNRSTPDYVLVLCNRALNAAQDGYVA
jgi:hypothetical protein